MRTATEIWSCRPSFAAAEHIIQLVEDAEPFVDGSARKVLGTVFSGIGMGDVFGSSELLRASRTPPVLWLGGPKDAAVRCGPRRRPALKKGSWRSGAIPGAIVCAALPRPQWLLAIPDAIRQLEDLDRELLVRRDIEQVFGVSRARTAQLMHASAPF